MYTPAGMSRLMQTWTLTATVFLATAHSACTSRTSVAAVTAAPAENRQGTWAGLSLPFAQNVVDLNDAPVVVVDGHRVLVDGDVVGDTLPIEQLGRVQRIDGLFRRLKEKRDAWKAANPGATFSGECNLAIDAATPADVVKSVFQTAAFAGYPNLSFVVRRWPSRPNRAVRAPLPRTRKFPVMVGCRRRSSSASSASTSARSVCATSEDSSATQASVGMSGSTSSSAATAGSPRRRPFRRERQRTTSPTRRSSRASWERSPS